MNRMRKNRPLWKAGLVLLLAVVMLVIGIVGTGRLHAVQSFFAGLVVPFQRAYTYTTTSIRRYITDKARERQLLADYHRLNEQVTRLTIENAQIEVLRNQNDRLTELLGEVEKYPELNLRMARVIGKGSGNFFATFTIDIGENQGVELDMAILAQGGLVGRVIEVHETYSVIMSIIDGRSSVGGVVERTRDNGMVQGSLNLTENDDSCRMEYLPYETELVPGDVIITSGLDQIFPKGLRIGEVKEVSRENISTQYVVIKPGVDFRHLEEVLVVFSDSVANDENLGVEDSE